MLKESNMREELQTISLSMTKQQLEDLRTLFFQECRRSYLTGGSSVSAEDKRRRESFKAFYDQLPPGLPPDVQES